MFDKRPNDVVSGIISLLLLLLANGGFSECLIGTGGEYCCPSGRVPLIEKHGGRARVCSPVNKCPFGYRCSEEGICCGQPSQCPPGQTVFIAKNGAPISCSILDDDFLCPGDSTCQPSSSDSSTYFCCHKYSINESSNCPPGWYSTNNQECQPDDGPAICPKPAKCLSYHRNGQYSCCYKNDSAVRPVDSLRCADEYSHAERLHDGRVRRCGTWNPRCSTGYSCQISSKSVGLKLCCSDHVQRLDKPIRSQYRCPMDHRPVLTKTSVNVFCTKLESRQVCPSGSICKRSVNAPGVFICCNDSLPVIIGQVATIHRLNQSPQCPSGRRVQKDHANQLVICDPDDPSMRCDHGYSCTQSTNMNDRSICCSLESIPEIEVTCPEHRSTFTVSGGVRYCSPNDRNACPENYQCQLAANRLDDFICCSTEVESISCPSDFRSQLDTNGSQIFCSPNNPSGCPEDSTCLLATDTGEDQYICCYSQSSSSSIVCPNGGTASILPNGRIEECTGPNAQCAHDGYSCQFSMVWSNWICCATERYTVATCTDDRETFVQIEGETYTCDQEKIPTNCPVNYECAPSTVAHTSVCCLKLLVIPTESTVQTTILPPRVQCPVGWNAYRNAEHGSPQYCRSIDDDSCPVDFSCAQSSTRGVFMCCRIAGSLKCGGGLSTLFINNRARLCNLGNTNLCPVSYSCKPSNFQNIYVCCSDAHSQLSRQQSVRSGELDDIRCSSDMSNPFRIRQHIRFCPTIGQVDGCPTGYVCAKTTRSDFNACCRPTLANARLVIKTESMNGVCGPNGVALVRNGHTVKCTDGDNHCPRNYACQPSFINSEMNCCLVGPAHHCSDGSDPIGDKHCKTSDDCDDGQQCQALIDDQLETTSIRMCCAARITDGTRCVGRQTFLRDSTPIYCSEVSDHCPANYVCSRYTNTLEPTCCSSTTKLCPQNRDHYRKFADGAPFYCDKTDFTCPDGYLCKQSLVGDRFICCSPIGFCPIDQKAFIDQSTEQPKRCYSDEKFGSRNSEDCPEGYTCQQSNVEFIRVCCKGILQSFINTSAMHTIL